jgi:hypothetical protein
MKKTDLGLEIVNARWKEANYSGREQILAELRRQGLSIGESLYALAAAEVLTLGEANAYVSRSPAWRVEVKNARALQEIAWQVLEEFTKQ